jgi:4,5-dihydroxyphthalate decarboxylase
MGPSWWSYGLAGNEEGLAVFLHYAREQGLARRPLTPAGLFAPETLESYVI